MVDHGNVGYHLKAANARAHPKVHQGNAQRVCCRVQGNRLCVCVGGGGGDHDTLYDTLVAQCSPLQTINKDRIMMIAAQQTNSPLSPVNEASGVLSHQICSAATIARAQK